MIVFSSKCQVHVRLSIQYGQIEKWEFTFAFDFLLAEGK